MITLFAKRPWIIVVAAFVVLITGWVFLLRLAYRNQPEAIPVHEVENHEQP